MNLFKNVRKTLKTIQNLKFHFSQAIHIGRSLLILCFEAGNGLFMFVFSKLHGIVGFLHLHTTVNGTSDSNSTSDSGSSA